VDHRRLAAASLLGALLLVGAAGCAGAHKEAPPPVPPVAAPPSSAPVPAFDPTQELSLARTAQDEGRYRDASVHLERVIRADPAAFEPRMQLAELLLQQSIDLRHAGLLLREAEALRPEDVRVGRYRGWLAELRGDDAAAVAEYQRVLAMRPDPELRLRRGVMLRRLGRMEEALAELERVASERPADRAARASMAEIYEFQGRLGEAEAALVSIAQLAPADPLPQKQLVAFYRRHGQARKAIDADARARALEGAPRSLRPLRPSMR
jgi:tetratricopeptide (TPR) repeat protein